MTEFTLRDDLEAIADKRDAFTDADRALFDRFRTMLNEGSVRAAEPDGEGGWQVNAWVKRGILTGFRMGTLVQIAGAPQSFVDKDTYPLQSFVPGQRVRVVPGGSSVRDGAFLAPGVVCMPPMFVNVGAYVDAGTMIDSHALVGSCAQIGRNVHLSAAAQIGGVIEPIGARPVVIEDDVLVGGGCGVYEGTLVRQRAVLAPGVQLTAATPVFDLVREETYRATPEAPLEIPEGAVVVPGSRAVTTDFGRQNGLALYAAVIVKYRDRRTDAAAQLEDVLR